MCGIYGFIGKPNKKTKKALRSLAISNEVRGTDSSGLYLDDGRQGITIKSVGDSTNLFDSATTNKHLGHYTKKLFMRAIGHTRMATVGAVTVKNAHPFKSQRHTFAHNGCIYNFTALQEEFGTTHEVDSEIIGDLLDMFTPIEVFGQKLSGWYAVPYIVFNDTKALNIARHTSPLAMFMSSDKKQLYYSSVEHHLKSAMKHAGIRGTMMSSGDDRIYRITFDNEIKVAKQKFEVKCDYVVSGYGGGWNWDKEDDEDSGHFWTPKAKKTKSGVIVPNDYDPDEDMHVRGINWDASNLKEYPYKGMDRHESIVDIAYSEGCCTCGEILRDKAWVSEGGYVYCKQCKPIGLVKYHALY